MAEGYTYASGDIIEVTAAAAYSDGDMYQVPDGRAGIVRGDVASGAVMSVEVTEGLILKLTKTSGVVGLAGGRAYWDHSANAVTYKKVNDRDYYIGRYTADAASTATVCYVALNVDPKYDVDMLNGEGGFLSVPTGTQATGSAGFNLPRDFGGTKAIRVTATNEAQCIDMLSVDRFALSSNWIAEFVVRLAANGSGSACDLTWGVANGTSTTDADTITESCFFHIDGGALTILAESDDGTTEVAATTTTISITEGTAVANRFEFWLDGRDTTNVKYYINGAEVNEATSNMGKLTAASGPLFLNFIAEKTADDSPLVIKFRGRVRTMQQD